MKNFWSKFLAGFATLVTVLALSTNAQAAPLSGQPNVSLDFNGVSQTSKNSISFTTTTAVGGDINAFGKIKIDYPSGFDISNAAIASLPVLSPLGIVDNFSISGQSATISFHHDGGLPAGSNVSFDLTGIINPSTSGSYHLAVSTLRSDNNNVIDGPTNSFDFSIQPRGPNQTNSSISPTGLNNMVVGTTQDIIFTARDDNNNVLSNQDVVWSLTGSDFHLSKTTGSTNSNGQDTVTLTAPNTSGLSTTVTVTSGTVVYNVTFTTQFVSMPGSLHHWGISNISTPQTAGSFFDVFVTPYDQYNNVITDYDWTNLANRPVFSGLDSVGGNDPCYNYSSDAGGIATYSITPYAAQLNASITTTLGTANGISNNFNVNHSTVTSVTISPLDDTVTAGNTKTYTATAHDIYGNTWDVTTDSTFGIDAAANGSWAANVYTSETAGDFTVTATYGALNDSTGLHVDPAALHHIIITTADPTTIIAGQTVQFTAHSYDIYGNERTGDVFTWTNVDTTGLFTNTLAGTYPVRAHSGGIDSDPENVTVEPAALHHIIIVPSTDTTITAGQTITFVAHSYDIYGNERSVDTFTWSGTSAIDCGLFDETTVGTYQVQAFSNGVPSNVVNVTVNHAVATWIALTPDSATILAGETQTYFVTAHDDYGNSWNATTDSSFDIFGGGDGGSWLANVYTAHTAGTWTVRATLGTLADDVILNVNHNVATNVTIAPNTTQDITAGADVNFTALAYDAFGNLTGDVITWTGTSAVDSGLFNERHTGTYTVYATANGVESTRVTVNVDHNVTTNVTISPDTTQDITAGDHIDFTATAYDAYGNPTGDVITWTGTSASDSGLFNTTTTGTYTVYAIANGVESTHVTVNVNHNVATSINITPVGPVNMTADQSQAFIATASDAYGNSWDVTSLVTWNENDPIGSFAGNTYDAGAVGTWTIFATLGALNSNNVTVNVSAGALHHINIIPDTTQNIVAGQTVQFTAQGYDQDGNAIAGLAYSWSGATGGLFNNTVAGTYTVYAFIGAIETIHVTVNVSAGALHHINITPNTTQTITAGATVQFTPQGYDSYNNAIAGLTYTWTNTTTTGLFNSTTAGTYGVQAHSGGIDSNIVNITVLAAALHHIDITPNTTQTITAGNTVQFTAIAYDQYNNIITGLVLSWNNATSSGLFNNTSKGDYTVYAYSGATESSHVTVTVNPGALYRVTISAATTRNLTAGQTYTFTVTSYDQFGNTLTGQTHTWSNTSSTSSGLFNNTIAGTYYVQAHNSGIDSNIVMVVVSPAALNHIDITPNTTQTITAGGTVQFTAVAHDIYHNVISDQTILWSGATNGLFNITASGSYTVYAYVGAIESTHVTVNVNSGALHHINITPNTTQTVTTGATVQFAATGYDVYGNAISALVFTWDNTNTSGLFTNTTLGTYVVQAHSSGIGSNTVNVSVIAAAGGTTSNNSTSGDSSVISANDNSQVIVTDDQGQIKGTEISTIGSEPQTENNGRSAWLIVLVSVLALAILAGAYYAYSNWIGSSDNDDKGKPNKLAKNQDNEDKGSKSDPKVDGKLNENLRW